MTRDYAKKKTHLSARTTRGVSVRALIPGWAWMLIGLGFGGGLTILGVWKWGASSRQAPKPSLVVTQNDLELQTNELLETKPRFEFYTVLPNMKVEVAEESPHEPKTQSHLAKLDETPAQKKPNVAAEPKVLSKPEISVALKAEPKVSLSEKENLKIAKEAPKVAAIKEAPLTFMVQAGSFKTRQQAENLKAKLAMSGVESRIEIIQASGTWYRVNVGPFPNKTDALAMQQNLQQSGTANGLIVKIKV